MLASWRQTLAPSLPADLSTQGALPALTRPYRPLADPRTTTDIPFPWPCSPAPTPAPMLAERPRRPALALPVARAATQPSLSAQPVPTPAPANHPILFAVQLSTRDPRPASHQHHPSLSLLLPQPHHRFRPSACLSFPSWLAISSARSRVARHALQSSLASSGPHWEGAGEVGNFLQAKSARVAQPTRLLTDQFSSTHASRRSIHCLNPSELRRSRLFDLVTPSRLVSNTPPCRDRYSSLKSAIQPHTLAWRYGSVLRNTHSFNV